jgi:putative transposase
MLVMPRMARLVVPGYPHHITQRGSRRQKTFFDESDYRAYLGLIRETRSKAGVDIWAYCLMPNHVHLVAVPEREDSLASMLRVTHHRHARRVNAAQGWSGHLWQERFYSVVMDESHLLAAVRYTELNPVRAGLCDRVEDWRWSSVHAHVHGKCDGVVNVDPMLERIGDWQQYLSASEEPEAIETLRSHSSTGRPAGSTEFIKRLERLSGRTLRKRRPGPRRRS